MPKRTDIKTILVLGAGPIIIGQACEFDYAGTQACKALKEEGYRVILVNSNPATIMTDPDIADITYIEPIHWKIIEKIIEKENPDALLPTMGGQTVLNCSVELSRKGILKKNNVKIIGITIDSIKKAENRRLFDSAMTKIGLKTAKSIFVNSIKEALLVVNNIGFPCVIRPSFTLGGTGGGIANNELEFKNLCEYGLSISPTHEILINESLIGWKEYELELIRDKKNNCIVICSIENVDPMGIHTGDSITVVPAQTLTDKEYQIMRSAAISVLNEIGVDNGGANVQFSINPNNGTLIIVEMNPRVSRSSALASKATGFPIAKIATKLAIGYTLDELVNDVTKGNIPASFEPSIDYIVTKIPRFNFEKFMGVDNQLTTQMKSIGEVMAIGRTQQESLQKALCSLEIEINGLDSKISINNAKTITIIKKKLKYASGDRILYIADAFRIGMSINDIYDLTKIDKWFLFQIKEIIIIEKQIIDYGINKLHNIDYLLWLKKKGFSDARLAFLTKVSEEYIRKLREKYNLHPVYKKIDTCAAEFNANVTYMYSTYSEECESNPTQNEKKIIIIGSGPNRIGQGIEFDYCCVHASLALKEIGYETIMINCNPETVSTDYDISDRLYFEPITLENILEIIRIEKPKGIIIQYGGQTPIKLVKQLKKLNISILGTNPDSIDIAEDREKFKYIINDLKLKQPKNSVVNTIQQAIQKAKNIGYPIIIRPSYVLGGRFMEIIFSEIELINYFNKNINILNNTSILLDEFLENAIEVDVDAICDGKNVLIGGIMEHIEPAGIHSGDSACSLPAYTLSSNIQNIIRIQTKKIALKLNIIGLINIQFAIKNNEIYLIEVNPRASRTIPFISKAIGIPLVKISTLVIIGKTLLEQNIKEIQLKYFFVKEAILPFNKFHGVDPILGPEMKSTGEIMGIGCNFAEAFAKTILNDFLKIKKRKYVLLIIENDTINLIELITNLFKIGFIIDIDKNTACILKRLNINLNLITVIPKKDNIINLIKKDKYTYIINTGKSEFSKLIRYNALYYKVYLNTTIKASIATLIALNTGYTKKVISLQEIHKLFIKKNK